MGGKNFGVRSGVESNEQKKDIKNVKLGEGIELAVKYPGDISKGHFIYRKNGGSSVSKVLF